MSRRQQGTHMDKRAHIIVSGRVQKAGFRIFVDRVAFELDLKGMVRNLEDGTVEIICEGPEDRLDEFSRMINIRKYPIRVDDLKRRITKASGEFKDFDIIKDGRSDSDLEGKVDLGTVFIQDLSARQEDTTKAVKSMHSDMTGSFGHLNNKYGEFGKTLKGVRKDTKGMASNMKGMNTGMKTMASDMKGMKGSMSGMASDIKVIRKEATRGRKKPAPG